MAESTLTVRDPRFIGVVGSTVEFETIATGCLFTEGPLWHPSGHYLLWGDMPGDHLRPDVPSLKGGQVAFQVPATLSSALSDVARGESATTFMALLACWKLLLHRYTQQDDIIIGTPTGRRYLAETEGMIGLFINNLVLRTQFTPTLTFRELLAQVRQTTIDAFTHDELPFEDLVAELRPERTSGVSPFFQHLFIHRNATHSRWEIPGLTLTPVAAPLPEFATVIVYAIVSPTSLWFDGGTTVLSSAPILAIVSVGCSTSGVFVVALQVEPTVVGLQTLLAVVVAVLSTEPLPMSAAVST